MRRVIRRPAKCQQMAQAMIDEGADMVYQVAGGTGIGIIETARAAGRYTIGVDTDQDGVAPGNVLTSMFERVDMPWKRSSMLMRPMCSLEAR